MRLLPTQAKQLGILEFIPGFLFTFLLSVFLKQFIRFQLVSRTQALQIRHTKARIPWKWKNLDILRNSVIKFIQKREIDIRQRERENIYQELWSFLSILNQHLVERSEQAAREPRNRTHSSFEVQINILWASYGELIILGPSSTWYALSLPAEPRGVAQS